MKIFEEYGQNAVSLSQRLNKITSGEAGNLSGTAPMAALLGMLDMTTLEGTDTDARVAALCRQARFSMLNPEFDNAAAVCVYPSLIRTAARELQGTGIKVASVAGAFPSGQSSLRIKLDEIRYALDEGATEIDTVISRGKLIGGRVNEVSDELAAMKEECGDRPMKVILETGELQSVGLIRQASEIAILSGADFLKTSTGKISIGATPEAFMVMADTILEYLRATGKSVGIKAAGGIRAPEQALVYAAIVNMVLGESFLNKNLFRIGASSLAGEILKQLT